MSQQQVERGSHSQEADEEQYTAVAEQAGKVATAAETEERSIDDLLAEIDATLESNAEQFVADFKQKGGE